MTAKQKAVFTKQPGDKKIKVVREFTAPPEKVWAAWTQADLLDQWWAPKPWKAITKSMDFREGGYWLYSMMGPAGEQSWNREDFITIEPKKLIILDNYFCDENGNKDVNMPCMKWEIAFHKSNDGTKMDIEIAFEKKEDFDKIVAMGFEGGFTHGLNNLDEVLEK